MSRGFRKSLSATAAPRTKQKKPTQKGKHMLWTIFVVLLILWLLGFIGQFGGALIHLLLVVAVVVLIINLISGRRSL
jgi:fatty acid desaturase